MTSMESVNIPNPLAIADEDRNEVMRSDDGKKLTEKLHQTTTTAKQKTSKNKHCFVIQT